MTSIGLTSIPGSAEFAQGSLTAATSPAGRARSYSAQERHIEALFPRTHALVDCHCPCKEGTCPAELGNVFFVFLMRDSPTDYLVSCFGNPCGVNTRAVRLTLGHNPEHPDLSQLTNFSFTKLIRPGRGFWNLLIS